MVRNLDIWMKCGSRHRLQRFFTNRRPQTCSCASLLLPAAACQSCHNLADHYNWCAVPDKGYDAVLFGGMAVVVAALLQGKYAALWTLIAGGSSDILCCWQSAKQLCNADAPATFSYASTS